MGWLSTHVLDTANGCPAAEMTVTLWRISPLSKALLPENPLSDTEKKSSQSVSEMRADFLHLKTVITNKDGRTDTPLLEGGSFQKGMYEIVFAVGDYFVQRSEHDSSSMPDTVPFLDLVLLPKANR